MSSLREKIQAGKKIITAEITPPKGAGVKKLLQHASLLGPHVDAMNITDCQRALVRMSSMAACKVLLDHGFEPVYQLTCRDRNTIGIQSDLMGAAALGIPNLLCLTGDPVNVGDSPKSKPVFEMESVGLLNLVAKLQQGRDWEDHKLNARTKFLIGAVVNPVLGNHRSQFTRMEKKLQAGAEFFQTQANYDLDEFYAFLMEARNLRTKVFAGILILNSFEMAEYIHQNIPGIGVPSPVLQRLQTSPDPLQTGIDFAVETMLKMDEACDGFHLMSIRAEELIPRVLEKYHAQRKAAENSPSSVPSTTRR